MKPKINFLFPTILALVISMLPNSCAKNEPVNDQFKGNLKLSVNLSAVVYDTTYKTKTVSSGNFQVQIFRKDEETPAMTFEHASEMPELIELTEGEYYVTAVSGTNPGVAFESPYYYGESELFTIVDGVISNVTVTCTLANIMVTVVYSDQVIASFDDYHTTVSNTTGNLQFAKGETRPGFFDAGPLSIESVLDYTTEEGQQTKTLTGSLEVQAGKHYEIHVDTTPEEHEGNAGFDIIVDDNVETVTVGLTDEGVSVPSEAGTGELLITEIMYDPKGMNDSDGEWIEVFNNSDEIINLKDLVFKRGSVSSFHRITADIELNPGDYAVLGKTSSATDNVDYVCSAISLPQKGDELIIKTFGTDGTDGSVICAVDYSAEGFNEVPEGKSLQLDPSVRDVNAARLGSNWCASTQTYSTEDCGTPGLANSTCK